MSIADPIAEATVASGRPSRTLPLLHLLNLSVYWMGINAIWAGLGTIVWQARMSERYGEALGPFYVTLLESVPVFIAIIVQPTVAMLSDYTISRWGRRKPYILIGTLLDMVFLWGVASANEFVAIFALLVLLQVSSNFAQGPFQGYVPDLVPAKQVGTASGLMGVMIIAGQVAGVAIAAIGLAQLEGNPYPRGTVEAGQFAQQAFFLPTIALGLIELLTMVPLVLFIDEGRTAPARGGRSWLQIALGAWGTDILRERSYVWLLISRLFFLMAPSVLIFLGVYYLRQSLGSSDAVAADQMLVIVAVMGGLTGLATFPAARLSDRIGRKRTIYISIVVGIAGMLGVAVAPTFELAVAALVPVGVSAGSFLAVDWALMTDIIPKATAGRYMGISAVATGASGPFGRLLAGPLLTLLVLIGLPPGADPVTEATLSTTFALGPRLVLLVPVVFFLVSAWALRRVDETRRED
ncbi:MAG: MFS transporter [Chloroflexota bacterium]|nr:MFS transporter [Chloroflexota bacterium]